MRDPIDGIGMAARFLPQVEARQRHAECRNPPQKVGKAAARDQVVARVMKRFETELQRFGEILRMEVRVRR